jgi:hypothetical protein
MRRALVPLGLLLSSLVHASEVRWHCVLSAELTRLHCAAVPAAAQAVPVGTADPDAPGAAEPATAPPTPVAEVRGTRFPLDTRGTWTVDLWTPPSDGAFVEQLARATICYRTPRCTVKVDLRPLSQRDARASTR